MAKKYTVLETWIVNTTHPVESNSAEQTYERMECQSGGKLPVLDFAQDLRREQDFFDECMVRGFAAHMGQGQELLDIGPGDGWPLLRLAPFFRTITGAEPSARRVTAIQAHAERLGLKNVIVKQASALELPFADNTFDGIVAASSIEQTADPYQALREVFRVLKPGGRFRVSFEACGTSDRGFAERVFLTETDDSYGYHYVITHHLPPWERNYLLRFARNDETRDEFAKLTAQIERLGPNPAVNTEIGSAFVERNAAHVAGSSWYELEHFTSATMKQTLEDVGFVSVRITWSAATLARRFWPRIADAGMPDPQAQAVCQGLADVALVIEAPSESSEPVVATKPS